MTAALDLGSLYGNARGRIIEQLIHGLEETELATVVPACPEWTVRDVISHLVGITDDALNGNMEGAPSSAWTAAQVAKRKDRSIDELLAEWDTNSARFEHTVAMNDIRPPVLDIATHEQDLRGALGMVGARENPVIGWGLPLVIEGFSRRVADAGLSPVFVDLEGEESDTVAGGDRPGIMLRTTRFELFRAVFGRRSERQLRAMGWSDDPSPYLAHLVFFDPSPTDIIE